MAVGAQRQASQSFDISKEDWANVHGLVGNADYVQEITAWLAHVPWRERLHPEYQHPQRNLALPPAWRLQPGGRAMLPIV